MSFTLSLIVAAATSLGVAGLARLFQTYQKSRRTGFEDRYMAQYTLEDWEDSNMQLTLMFPEEEDTVIKNRLKERLETVLKESDPSKSLYHEVAIVENNQLTFSYDPNITVDELLQKRQGIYFEMEKPGLIKVTWSHAQADGLRMWREIRPLFDPNPHVLAFDGQKHPMPVIPELLSLPTTLKNMTYRSHLRPLVKPEAELNQRFHTWSINPIKHIKNKLKGSFNLVSTSLLLEELFQRHPEAERLTVGLTVAFTFLEAKNQYGVITLQVKRGNFFEIYKQVTKQVVHPIQIWGNFSNQSLALSLMPDKMFSKVIDIFRGRIDVLISNLPAGKFDATINETPVNVGVHTENLSIPYYFLLLGTASQIHLSCTTRFEHNETFLNQERILARLSAISPAELEIDSSWEPAAAQRSSHS
ncbi:MAG: hypothetical protein EP343_15035 [Deltaproteobacteria bacterium]|nr:MAG: hypothetical protein EP343_15035 [Deltaproteobacteria bacterium]